MGCGRALSEILKKVTKRTNATPFTQFWIPPDEVSINPARAPRARRRGNAGGHRGSSGVGRTGWRQREVEAVSSPAFRRALEDNHIILIGWRDIKKLL